MGRYLIDFSKYEIMIYHLNQMEVIYDYRDQKECFACCISNSDDILYFGETAREMITAGMSGNPCLLLNKSSFNEDKAIIEDIKHQLHLMGEEMSSVVLMCQSEVPDDRLRAVFIKNDIMVEEILFKPLLAEVFYHQIYHHQADHLLVIDLEINAINLSVVSHAKLVSSQMFEYPSYHAFQDVMVELLLAKIEDETGFEKDDIDEDELLMIKKSALGLTEVFNHLEQKKLYLKVNGMMVILVISRSEFILACHQLLISLKKRIQTLLSDDMKIGLAGRYISHQAIQSFLEEQYADQLLIQETNKVYIQGFCWRGEK